MDRARVHLVAYRVSNQMEISRSTCINYINIDCITDDVLNEMSNEIMSASQNEYLDILNDYIEMISNCKYDEYTSNVLMQYLRAQICFYQSQ